MENLHKFVEVAHKTMLEKLAFHNVYIGMNLNGKHNLS
jgi:hypothetical protein